MSLWKIIAKNEFKVATWRFKKKRNFIFILILTICIFWAFYLGPNLIDLIWPTYIKLFVIEYDFYFIEFMEYYFMTLFLFNIMIPLYNLYRKSEIGYIEILLSSPVKKSEIFLGEFIGRMPFYFLMTLITGPLITSALMQFAELNLFHFFIV